MFARRLFPVLVSLIALSSIAAVAEEVTVPVGTQVHFKISRSINTATVKAGANIPGELTAPLTIGGRTVAPAGSYCNVHVAEAEASGRMGGSARIRLYVSSIKLANGQSAPVKTSSYSREGKAHAKHNATYIATAGVIGALAGQAIGGNSRSTAQGAAIGAGVGVGAAAATGKFDFELKAGERFALKLRTPIKTMM